MSAKASDTLSDGWRQWNVRGQHPEDASNTTSIAGDNETALTPCGRVLKREFPHMRVFRHFLLLRHGELVASSSVSYHKTGYLAFTLVVQANFPWQGWCAHTATADMHTPLLTLVFADKGMA